MPEKTSLQRNYIAGEWLAGASEIENRNPSDLSDLVGRYAQAEAAQLDTALNAARDAQRLWAKTGIERRYDALMAIGNELMARADELGQLLSREEGKPFAEGRGEVYRSGQFFTYYAAETLRRSAPLRSSRHGTSRLPLRPGKSRRHWPSATLWSGSQPTWCRRRPSRWPRSLRARTCLRGCST